MPADPPRTTLLLRLAYDGSSFRGVVPQPGQVTVADALGARLREALGEEPKSLVLASRTDTGVHAVENLATCWFPGERDPALLAALQAPRDDGLACVEGRVVPDHVFARTVGRGKHYRYRLEGGWDPAEIARVREHDLARKEDPRAVAPAPPHEARTWQVAPELDPEAMRAAARHLLGTHDFSAFKVGPLGERSPVRTLTGIEITETVRGGRPHLVIDVRGTGFLRRMVRIVVGTLAEVGAGLRAPDEVAAILDSRDRQRSGQAALARGLVLIEVLGARRWFPEAWSEAPL